MLQNILTKQELNALARVKSVYYHSKSVHPKLVDEEISAGWEVFKKGKNSVRLKKHKNLGATLEDRVWTLLFKLDFGYLSAEGGGKLKLNPTDDNTTYNQIDVFGIDDELALMIECKSSESFNKRPQFQAELAKLAEMKERAGRAVNEQWPAQHKRQLVQLFFLQNINISDTDRERAKLLNIFYLMNKI